jgi:hypothetical protein
MKKIIYIILVLYSTNILSQSCDGFNSSTYQSTISVWDWRNSSAANWTAWIDVGSATPTIRSINSPFEPTNTGQPNTQHLWLNQNTRDYQSTEGWELVYKDFGVNSITGVSNPHFILYNRFRSIMRFFYCTSKPQTLLTGSKIHIEWNGGKVSTLFESSKSSMYSNTTFSKYISVDVANKYPIGDQYIWHFADIPVNYDPCTCGSSKDKLNAITPNISSFMFGVDVYTISTSVFNINQVIKDSASVIVAGQYNGDGGDILTNLSNAGNYFFSHISSGLTRGNQINTSITKTLDGITKAHADIVSVSNLWTKRDEAKVKEKDVKLPALFKTIPYIGEVFGIFESFFGGGKNSDKNNTTNSAVPLRFSMTGQSITNGGFSGKSIYTPGSPHTNIVGQSVVKPVYNYVMGTFALLEEPKLEAVLHGIGSRPSAYQVGGFMEPPLITKYRLKEPIKYAINPSSQLEVIDIQTALEYQLLPNFKDGNMIVRAGLDTNHHLVIPSSNLSGQIFNVILPAIGPVFSKRVSPNLSYKEVCEENGVYIANWPLQNKIKGDPNGNASLYNITYSTGFFNPICHNKYSFAIADYWNTNSNGFSYNTCNGSMFLYPAVSDWRNYLNFSESNLKITMKVKLILRRKDANANSNTEDIVRLISYDLTTPKAYLKGDLGYPQTDMPRFFYDFNTCVQSMGRYGVDYSIDSFSSPILGGVGVMPLGKVAYPDTVIITSWTPQNQNQVIFANKVIIVKAYIYSNAGYKVILRAGNMVMMDVGSSLAPDRIETEISIDPPGCEDVMSPQSYSYIQSYCADQNKYNPNFNKMISTKIDSNKKKVNYMSVSIYPNPTLGNSILELTGYQNTDISIRVYDMIGREVWSRLEKDITLPSHKVEVESSRFETGIYIINIDNGVEKKSMKLEVRR